MSKEIIQEGLSDLLRLLSMPKCYQKTETEITILTLSPDGKKALDLLGVRYTENTFSHLVIPKEEYIRLVKLAEDY
jgi:hypothetical protein